MIHFDIVTAVPKVFGAFFTESVIGRAIKNDVASVNIINLRDYGLNKYQQIDDAPYGGGAGMVLMPEPLDCAIKDCLQARKYDEIIFFLPEGEKIIQKMVNSYSVAQNILIICGHYKGIDQRIVDMYATKIISIGDFIITGGEIAAALFVDAVIRVCPGAIGDEQSALEDSFQDSLLSPPVYTRPETFNAQKVPAELLSGNHQLIANWKMEQAIEKTKKFRPDLLDGDE